jgi:hypothetical protein
MDQQEVEHNDTEDHRQRGDQPVSHIAGKSHGLGFQPGPFESLLCAERPGRVIVKFSIEDRDILHVDEPDQRAILGQDLLRLLVQYYALLLVLLTHRLVENIVEFRIGIEAVVDEGHTLRICEVRYCLLRP